MNPDEDLYAILGVLPDAEAIVITAAYRALAARYHPDRWQGPKEVAHARMVDINRAYAVLGDPEKRREYDVGRRRSEGAFKEATDDQSKAFDEALSLSEDKWNIAISVFPKLAEHRKRLSKTSYQLAFAFVTVVLDTKRFDDAAEIADSMEQRFLERYFGTNPQILAFARELIDLGFKDAVKGLNQLVDVLGSEVRPGPLIQRILKDYDVNNRRRGMNEGREAEFDRQHRLERIQLLRDRIERLGQFEHLVELARLFGFSVLRRRRLLFQSSAYEVRKAGSTAVILQFASEKDLFRWAGRELTE